MTPDSERGDDGAPEGTDEEVRQQVGPRFGLQQLGGDRPAIFPLRTGVSLLAFSSIFLAI